MIAWHAVSSILRDSRLAVDIGGTFTDLVLATPRGTHELKLLTTPEAPERAVLENLHEFPARAEEQHGAELRIGGAAEDEFKARTGDHGLHGHAEKIVGGRVRVRGELESWL